MRRSGKRRTNRDRPSNCRSNAFLTLSRRSRTPWCCPLSSFDCPPAPGTDMFFDIAWPEFMLIGIVALIVIGPKDLPAALRVAGYWVRKARSLSREFHSSVEQMMREAELHEVQDQLKKATEFDLDREFQKIVDPVNDPAAGPPREVPDYLDMTPAPVISDDDPAPPPGTVEAVATEEEPELPLGFPVVTPEPVLAPALTSEPEPARAA